jgi:dTMP kinase
MRGKLIVVEGTDCSGKETQVKLLEKKLKDSGIKARHLSFPCYDTPTGEVIGASYLGKKELCQKLGINGGWFPEGATHVDSLVSSLYYAADRKYNVDKIVSLLNQGIHVILDRYTFSNMAHQGGKIESQSMRFSFFKKIEVLEFDLLELPKPDLVVLLYVPYQTTLELQKTRDEELDQNELDKKHLKLAEQTYLELKALYHFKMIECTDKGVMRSIESINNELKTIVEGTIL